MTLTDFLLTATASTIAGLFVLHLTKVKYDWREFPLLYPEV